MVSQSAKLLHFLERPGIWWTPFASDLLTCVFAGEGRSQDSCVQLDGCEALGTLESLSAGKTWENDGNTEAIELHLSRFFSDVIAAQGWNVCSYEHRGPREHLGHLEQTCTGTLGNSWEPGSRSSPQVRKSPSLSSEAWSLNVVSPCTKWFAASPEGAAQLLASVD